MPEPEPARAGRALSALVLLALCVGVLGAALLFLAGGEENPAGPVRRGPVRPATDGAAKPSGTQTSLEGPASVRRDPGTPAEERAAVLGGRREESTGVLPAEVTAGSDLLVLVVDVEGEPADEVPVAVCLDRGDRPFNFLVQRSDSEGRVHFRDLASRLQPQEEGEAGYAVALALPMSGRERLPIDPRALPDHPLRLVAPATGSLVVRLVEPGGALLQDGALVGLGPPGDPEENFRAYETRRSEGGEARFPRVALGERLRVRVVVGGRPPLAVAVDGPLEAGDEVVVPLTVDQGYPELVGRAVGPDGQPLGSRRGRVQLDQAGRGLRVLPLVTLADGTFTVRLFEDLDGTPARLALELTDSGRGFEAAVSDLALAPAGPTRLGDLHFLPRPLLVSGRVVDSAGGPLPGVSVRVEVADPSSPHRSWQTVGGVTDRDGRFEIHSSAPEERLRLVARLRGHRTARVELGGPGTRGLDVVLEAGEPDRTPVDGEAGEPPWGGGR